MTHLSIYAVLAPILWLSLATARETSAIFEFRAVIAVVKASGETDFKGATATLTPEERVAFPND